MKLTNLVQLLQSRADLFGDKRLFRFVRTQANDEVAITYGELHRRAMAISRSLESVARYGDRVLLLFPPGLEFIEAFFGCLYAGMVAVPALPRRRKRTATSLEAVMEVARPAAVLSSVQHHDEATSLYADYPGLMQRPWITVDRVDESAGEGWRAPDVSADHLAFLQFTSGSTASPKGVMLSHGNLMYNLSLILHAFENRPDSSAVNWLPLYHDMGLIGGILQPIYCGGSSTLLAPTAFLHRPLLWVETISRTRATVSGGPDFAYDLCARSVREGQGVELDLSCWDVAFTGAEPIRADTLKRFTEAFREYGFREESFFPCYGLAEATLIVSGGPRPAIPAVVGLDTDAMAQNRVAEVPLDTPSARLLVACGANLPGQEIAIADVERRTRCAEGGIGEIWVRGPSVAQGYFARPRATEATFAAHLADTGDGPFLRTGDLGFLRDGQLFVAGRLKDLIIIRGRNYYPEDIELVVQGAYDGFRPGHCAAFSIDVDDRESLVLVQEIEPRTRELDTDAAFRAIRRAVADRFEIEVHAVILAKAGSIPKTSSGKLRRSACRDRYLGGQQDVIAHWVAQPMAPEEGGAGGNGAPGARRTARQIEEWLIERIAVRLKLPRESVLTTTPFLDFGMGSLDAVQITADLERWLGRTLSPTAIYNHPSISALASWLASSPPRSRRAKTASPGDAAAVPAVPRDRLTQEAMVREVQAMSTEEIEALILREMAKQEGP